MKKIIIIIVIILIAIVSYFNFFREKESNFILGKAEISNISREVSETGQVKKGEEINLSFKNAGKIERIYVRTGDKVTRGNLLAKTETVQLLIQLQEAKEALSLAQSKLDKLLAGSSSENIKVAEVKVSNAEIALENAQQNLIDVRAVAQLNLNHAYEDALNVLDSSYLEMYNASTTIDSIQSSYFLQSDQEGSLVRDNKTKTETALTQAEYYLDIAKENEDNNDIDQALIEMKNSLKDFSDALRVIRETCEVGSYKNSVSSSDKTSLDTHKASVNTALTNTISSQQAIASAKVTNQSNTNTAQSSVSTAEGALTTAQNELDLIKAPPRQEDVDSDQAQVNQAQAQVDLLESQIEDAHLRSPINGLISRIENREGELAQSMTEIISLIPEEPFQIEVDIPEVDIGEVKLGDSCLTTLDALPSIEFQGEVIEIKPTETVIQGVVYYKVKVSIDEQDSRIKPGMTANVLIVTKTKENVLTLPQRAIIKKNGSEFVRIPQGEIFEERGVKTGLRGSQGEVEIISGLEEGEEIIVSIKK